jgi:hypothetical protein
MNSTSKAVADLSTDPFAIPRRKSAISPPARGVGVGVGMVALGALGTLALVGGARLLGRAAAGAAAGLVAGFAMNGVHAVWTAGEKELGVSRVPSVGRPPTVAALEKLAGPIARDHEGRAGTIAHYAMSAITGGVYPLLPFASAGRGLAYGAAVWLVADETLLAALRLSPPPWRFPLRTHARALVAHLVYGATLDALVRRWA